MDEGVLPSMNPVIFVAAARPNFVKIAALLRAFDAEFGSENRRLVHTGQHYDYSMSKSFFDQLNIPEPDVHFNIGSGTHGEQVGNTLKSFESYLISKLPVTGVVVVGDVNATLACTLAAVKLQVPVAHVEAGLRSFDRTMPEEINRILTDAVANIHFVSERSGVTNLRREGITENVHLVGNVMIDTLVQEFAYAYGLDMKTEMGLHPRDHALVTLHRPSNVDDEQRLYNFVNFLTYLSIRLDVVFPLHPRTRSSLWRYGWMEHLQHLPRLKLCEPLGYHENLGLMSSAKLVVTDSGGMQEEASYFGVPCLTFRDNTERPITIEMGTSVLIKNDIGMAKDLVRDICDGLCWEHSPIPLWDGKSSERIMRILHQAWFQENVK